MKKSRAESTVLKPEPVLPGVPSGIKSPGVITNGGLPKEKACYVIGGPCEQDKTEKYILHLSIAGNRLHPHAAVGIGKKICEDNLKGRYQPDIIHICQEKTNKPADPMTTARTLIMQLPLLFRRVTEYMMIKEKVLVDPGSCRNYRQYNCPGDL